MAFSPDELRGCRAFAGLPSSGVVVGVDEEREVVSQLVVVVMVGPFDGRLPDRAVRLAGRRLLAKAAKHPRDLTRHNCLCMRNPEGTVLDLWEFAKAGRQESVAVKGNLVSDDRNVIVDAALAGMGVAAGGAVLAAVTVFQKLRGKA